MTENRKPGRSDNDGRRPGGPGPLGRGGPPHGHLMGSERAKDTRGTTRRLWKYLRHHSTALGATILLVTVTTVFGVIGPYLQGKAIDEYIMVGDIPGLARIALLMLGTYAASAVTTWLQAYVMAGVTQRTIRDIRNDLFAKLQTLSLRFFDQRQHGELMSRLSNDVENINRVLSEGVTQLISSRHHDVCAELASGNNRPAGRPTDNVHKQSNCPTQP